LRTLNSPAVLPLVTLNGLCVTNLGLQNGLANPLLGDNRSLLQRDDVPASRRVLNFMRDGKTVATVPGTLKTNDAQVTQDDIVTDTTSANTKTLTEIDFGRSKEALIFEQSGM
jgi:hypothetical protein